MKLIRRIAISLSATFLVICCGALLLFNWPKTGWKALNVSTGSMRPTMPVGTLVLMHRVPVTSLKVGDVITYTNPYKANTTITHRIVKEYKTGQTSTFVTQGDANHSADQPITAGLIHGKVVWHTARLGAWLNWTSKPYLLLPIIYIPALAVMIEEMRRLSAYYKTQQPYVAPGYEPPRQKRSLSQKLALSAKLSIFLVMCSFISVRTVQAALSSQAKLTGNTISAINSPACTTSGGNTTVVVTDSGGNNNVNVTNTTNQTSSTGNVSSSGGSATSGSASNTSCTNINVTLTNH